MAILRMEPVQSKSIRAVGYDAFSKDLVVTFRTGASYLYEGVQAPTFHALKHASSVGSYFAHNVKDKHLSRKLPDDQLNVLLSSRSNMAPLEELVAAAAGGIPMFEVELPQFV